MFYSEEIFAIFILFKMNASLKSLCNNKLQSRFQINRKL